MSFIDTLRTPKIMGYALFDLVASFAGIWLFFKYGVYRFCPKVQEKLPMINVMILVLPFSVLVHLIFGSETKMTREFLTDCRMTWTILIMTLVGIFFKF